MNGAFLSAFAALAGSAVGGLTSFFSTWLGQSAQFRSQLLLHDKGRRHELYRDFVDQACQMYIDGLTHDEPDMSRAITLYALVSRMRIASSPEVAAEARRVAHEILDSYRAPNKTFGELIVQIDANLFDPLRAFSNACREELEKLSSS